MMSPAEVPSRRAATKAATAFAGLFNDVAVSGTSTMLAPARRRAPSRCRAPPRHWQAKATPTRPGWSRLAAARRRAKSLSNRARSSRMSLVGSGNCGSANSGRTTVSPRPVIPRRRSGRTPYAASIWCGVSAARQRGTVAGRAVVRLGRWCCGGCHQAGRDRRNGTQTAAMPAMVRHGRCVCGTRSRCPPSRWLRFGETSSPFFADFRCAATLRGSQAVRVGRTEDSTAVPRMIRLCRLLRSA